MLFLKRGFNPQAKDASGLGSRNPEKLIFSLFFLAVLFFFVDRAVVSWIKYVHDTKAPLFFFLEALTEVIDIIGHGSTLFIASLILYIGGRYSSEKISFLGKTLFIGLISSGVAAQVVKHLTGRLRPRRGDTLVFIGPSFERGYDSFPSGHTALAFCTAYILSRYFPAYRPLFYLYALAVGFQRIGDISHFPSDVFGGAVIGVIIAKLLLVKMQSREKTAACGK